MGIRHGHEGNDAQVTRLGGDEHYIEDGTLTSAYGIVVATDGRKVSGSAELSVTKTGTGVYEVAHPFETVVAVAAPSVAGRVLYVNAAAGKVTVLSVDQLVLEFADGGFHLILTVV